MADGIQLVSTTIVNIADILLTTNLPRVRVSIFWIPKLLGLLNDISLG